MKIGNYILISLLLLAVLHLILEFMHMIIIKKWKTIIQNESDYWVWGIFYFNPDDSRIIVPKRIEWLGWTLNFAQPISVVIIGGILFFISLIALIK